VPWLPDLEMARLPYADPNSVPESLRKVIERTPLSLHGIVAHAESAFEPWLRYSIALLTRLELDPLLREFAILQVAHTVASPYEWVQHAAIARRLGASEDHLAAIERGDDEHPSISEDQRQVLRFARAVIVDGCASETAVSELAARLGPRGVVELLLVIGHYMAIARLIATAGLEPDPPLAAAG